MNHKQMLDKTVEECGELIQALMKYKNGRKPTSRKIWAKRALSEIKQVGKYLGIVEQSIKDDIATRY